MGMPAGRGWRDTEEDLKTGSHYAKEVEGLKKGMAEPDLIELNEGSGEIDPQGRLEWDGHSEEAVFVSGDGVRLHLREGDDFAWAGREIGIGWCAAVEDGDFMVSERGLKRALEHEARRDTRR